MAADAHLASGVGSETLSIRHWFRFVNGRQVRIDARRRRRYLLTEKLLTNEQAASRWRRVVGLAGEREKRCMPENTGPAGIGGKLDTIEVADGRG
jgi:hypothetical protein